MDFSTAVRLSYANFLTKPRYDYLKAKFNTMEAALAAIDESLLSKLGCRAKTCTQIMARLEQLNEQTYLAALQKQGISLRCIEDDSYPEMLRSIPDPPIFLYMRGDESILKKTTIACVGTRAISPYGRLATKHFCSQFARSNVVTVSGLAFGVDAQVATSTIESGGVTVAVLAGGLANITPSAHATLAATIIQTGGLLLSEFPLAYPPDKYAFPARNRIIAGLSKATLVLQAGKKSGAAITAKLALDYNREVFCIASQLFDEDFAGCHALIATSQACIALSPQQVLTSLGLQATRPVRLFTPATDTETTVYNALSIKPQSVADVQVLTGLPIFTLNSTLTVLELQNAAEQVGFGQWVRA